MYGLASIGGVELTTAFIAVLATAFIACEDADEDEYYRLVLIAWAGCRRFCGRTSGMSAARVRASIAFNCPFTRVFNSMVLGRGSRPGWSW